jgi:hypothetical protein
MPVKTGVESYRAPDPLRRHFRAGFDPFQCVAADFPGASNGRGGPPIVRHHERPPDQVRGVAIQRA